MKQVNFKELSVEVGIDDFQQIDMRKEIGNSIHRQAVTVSMSDLARKIFHSEGPIEIDDEDYKAMMSVLSKSFAIAISDSVKRDTVIIKETNKQEEG